MAAVMFLRKAMRYYRLWIYTCNAVLLVSVIVFMGVGVGVASHPYLYLVPAPPAYHPTLLYGYVALLLQAGVLQALGCLGALRLSQRLLNIYWLLLLFLLLGDVVVGLVWLYRFSHLTEGLRPYVQATLRNQYGRDQDVTGAWDALQQAAKCCGALGPRDYNITWSVDSRHVSSHHSGTIRLPESCCFRNDSFISSSKQGVNAALGGHDDSIQSDQKPRHVRLQRGKSTNSDTSKNHVYSGGDSRGGGGGNNNNNNNNNIMQERNLTCMSGSEHQHHREGCASHLEDWFLKSAETLMILGFCVIAFIKLCFVGILRFEIQEMIQKIKILQGDAPCVPNPEIAAALGLVSPEKQGECGGLLSSGCDGDAGGGNEGGGGGNGGGGGGDSTQETASASATPLTQPRLNHLSGHTDGAESDTNSHCALITDTPVRRPQPDKRKPNGNNNDVTELRELRHVRQTQI